jgi:integrase
MTKAKVRSRTANSTIGYGVNGDNLRLNIPKTIHPSGKSQRIYVGLRDTKENRVQVENLCIRLNTLLAANQSIDWDNLIQYMPWKQHLTVVRSGEIKNIGWLAETYYTTALKPTLKESTQCQYEERVLPRLKPYCDRTINSDTIDDMMKDFLANPAGNKRYALSLLERAFDWAIQREKLTPKPNPFEGLSQQILSKPRVNPLTGMKAEYVGFTREERDLIIETFRTEKPVAYYSVIYFLFHTGCRHGEAFALTWDDISDDFKKIYFTKTYSSDVNKVLQGTKTDKKTRKTGRKFYCPDYLGEWLRQRKIQSSSNSQLLFPSSTGGYLNSVSVSKMWYQHNTCRQGVKSTYDGVVLKLAKQGRISEYVSAYHTRHTFISLAIETGFDTATIAELCGNSDSMVTNVYRSKVRNIDWNKLS